MARETPPHSAQWIRLPALFATILLAGPGLAHAEVKNELPDTKAAHTQQARPDSGVGREASEAAAQTDEPGEPPEERRRSRMEGPDEMAVLDRLLAMPPDELSRMRRAIEQIETMAPNEREALRERLRDFRQISPEDRKKMREKWRELSPEERHEHVQKMRERRWENVFNPAEGTEPEGEAESAR